MSDNRYSGSIIVALDGCIAVIVMVAAGAYFAKIGVTTIQILDRKTADKLSDLVVNLLLPCLLFIQMLNDLSTDKLTEFAIILGLCTSNFYVVHIFVGIAVGWVFGKISGASPSDKQLLMVCIAFQDTSAIPLTFASILGTSSVVQDGYHHGNFKTDANTYVLIYLVYINVYKWSLAYG